ncbi:MAG: hypothetical protein PHD01_16505, partial [Geobacteraceae bacterium]|nr:hypothetical protein [Geobacteraceae bacterium]
GNTMSREDFFRKELTTELRRVEAMMRKDESVRRRSTTMLIYGPTRTPGSWSPPDETANAPLATGDLFVERDGFYYYRGRSDDMFKSAGCWVSPTAVEEVLRGHPVVAECAVVATLVGALSVPGAFVVLDREVSESPELIGELRRHCRERLPDHMCPARIRFVTELPRTSTGKVQRFKLRERSPA